MKKYFASLCFILMLSIPSFSQAAAFSDVKAGTETDTAVQALAERNIINGYPDGTFRPNESLTRGQAAKIIANILQIEPVFLVDTQFKDVPESYAHYDDIIAVAELGIMTGYADETFKPNATLTRSQAAKIITEAFRLRSEIIQLPYVDVKSEETHYYVAKLYENNVTKSPGNRFYPNNKVTRAQFALFVTRAEKQQKAFIMYSHNQTFSAFGYTEYDEDIVDVELDLHRLVLHPVQEGTARIALYTLDEFEQLERVFYLIHVNEYKGELIVELEEQSIFDHISYATSVYHYRDGLYLQFVPKSYEILDEFGEPVPEDEFEIILDGEEVTVTMFTDGAYQLYFMDEENRSTHAILSIIENFVLDFSIETISPYIEITSSDLDFTMTSATIVDYLAYEDEGAVPFTSEFTNGTLTIRPTMLGEGVIRVVDTAGVKHYIDVIIYEKAGILVVDAVWE